MAFSGFEDSTLLEEAAVLPETEQPAPDPTPGTLGALAVGAKVPHGFVEFLEVVGADPETEVEAFLGMSVQDLEEGIASTVVDGITLSPIQKGGLASFVRRVFTNHGHMAPALGGAPPAPPVQRSSVAPPALPPQLAPQLLPFPPQPPQQEEVALSGVVDQSSRLSARLISYAELHETRQHYIKVCGRAPPEEHLPSAEQISGLKALLATGRVPYVDFAVWNRHGARLKHFSRSEASVFVNGAFVTRSLEGPSSVEAWDQCYALFSTAMISLGEASPGTMAMYSASLKTLLTLFPGKWDALLTTDILVRTERWGRLREIFETLAPQGYDPRKPWDTIIAASSYSHDGYMAGWWNTHFVLPATLSATSAGMGSMVDSLDGNVTGKRSWGQQGGQPKRTKAQLPQPLPKADKQAEKQNKSEICGIWNRRVGTCAKDGDCSFGRQHVCSFKGCGKMHRAIDHHAEQMEAQAGKKSSSSRGRWSGNSRK